MVNTSRRRETGSASENPSENNSDRNKIEQEVVIQTTDKVRSKANVIVGLRV
jgi:hypothetical protein